jgi:WD40 repeat protein
VSIGGGSTGNRVAIIDLHTHKAIGDLAFPPGTDRSFPYYLAATITPDARLAFCALDSSRIGVFALPSGRYLRSFTPAFANPDATRLVLFPWRVDPRNRLVVAGYDPGPNAADSSNAATSRPADDRLGLIDTSSGRLVAQARLGDIGAPSAIAWTHDGSRLAVGSTDGTLALYDAHSLKQIAHAGLVAAGPVDSLAFAPDDHTLVLGAGDVSFWSVPDLTREGEAVEIGGSQGSGGLWAWYAPDGDVVGLAGDANRPDASVRWFTLHARPADLVSIACQLAGADITPDQWRRYVADQPYRHVCS